MADKIKMLNPKVKSLIVNQDLQDKGGRMKCNYCGGMLGFKQWKYRRFEPKKYPAPDNPSHYWYDKMTCVKCGSWQEQWLYPEYHNNNKIKQQHINTWYSPSFGQPKNEATYHNYAVPDLVWKQFETFAPTLKERIQKWLGMNVSYKPTYSNLKTWLQMYMEAQNHYSEYLKLYQKLFGTYTKKQIDNKVNERKDFDWDDTWPGYADDTNDAKANYNFRYMAQMNDIPENRSNMDFLLKHGPNPDRTYDDYKFTWEDNEDDVKEQLKRMIVKMLSEIEKPKKITQKGKPGTYTEGFHVGQLVKVDLDDGKKPRSGKIVSFDPEDDDAGYIDIGGETYKVNFSWVSE